MDRIKFPWLNDKYPLNFEINQVERQVGLCLSRKDFESAAFIVNLIESQYVACQDDISFPHDEFPHLSMYTLEVLSEVGIPNNEIKSISLYDGFLYKLDQIRSRIIKSQIIVRENDFTQSQYALILYFLHDGQISNMKELDLLIRESFPYYNLSSESLYKSFYRRFVTLTGSKKTIKIKDIESIIPFLKSKNLTALAKAEDMKEYLLGHRD